MEKPERREVKRIGIFKLNGEKRVWEIGSFDYLLHFPHIADFAHGCAAWADLDRDSLFCSAWRQLGHLKVRGWNHLNASSHVWCLMLVARWHLSWIVVRTFTWPSHMAAWLLHSIVANSKDEHLRGKPGRSFIAFSNPVLKVMLCIIESHTG